MGLKAYIDDSGGTDLNQHKYFVLAGLLSNDERWAEFTTAWQAALAEPPGAAYLKMSEAGVLRKEFSMRKGWTSELRDQRIYKLTEIIRENAIFRLSVCVDKKAFRDHISSIKLKNPAPTAGNPYFLAFHKLVLGLPMLQAINLGTSQPESAVEFIFDEQGATGRYANEAWERIKTQLLPNMRPAGIPDFLPLLGRTPRYCSEKDEIPLQAADLLAWYMRKHASNNHSLIVQPHSNLARLLEIPGQDTLYNLSAILDLQRDILPLA